jgi:hypothetical protein
MTAAIRHMPQIPDVDAGDDLLLASIRPSTDDAALADQRHPCATLPPMLRVVVQELLLRPAPRELVRISLGKPTRALPQTCTDGQVAEWDNTNSDWTCANDQNTTYDGTDFATSGQDCPAHGPRHPRARGVILGGVDPYPQLRGRAAFWG